MARRRRELSLEAKLGVLATYGELRPMLAAGTVAAGPPPVERLELQPDPELAKKSPRGRTIEEVATIVADAEEHGATAAARMHRLSASAVSSMSERWRRHPVVLAALKARRPAIQARVRAHIGAKLEELDAKVRRLLGR